MTFRSVSVPGAGFEPASLTAIDFKSIVFTGFTTRAWRVHCAIDSGTYRGLPALL